MIYFWFCKRNRFWLKTKNIDKKSALNKSKNVLAENELDELSEKSKLLLTKKYSFLLVERT